MSTGGVKAMLLLLAAAKQVGLRGGYPGRRLVCSRASSIYWFKVSFLRGVSPRSTDLGDWLGSA